MDIPDTREPFPDRGSRRIRGASFDTSQENFNAIINFSKAYYTCAAYEYCPTTGKKHIQFYIACKNTVRLSTLRAAIKDAGFKSCDASNYENKLYVLKMREQDIESNPPGYIGNHDTFQEKGTFPTPEEITQSTLETIKNLKLCPGINLDLIDYLEELQQCMIDEVDEFSRLWELDHYVEPDISMH